MDADGVVVVAVTDSKALSVPTSEQMKQMMLFHQRWKQKHYARNQPIPIPTVTDWQIAVIMKPIQRKWLSMENRRQNAAAPVEVVQGAEAGVAAPTVGRKTDP
jgi:hypothetical protein